MEHGPDVDVMVHVLDHEFIGCHDRVESVLPSPGDLDHISEVKIPYIEVVALEQTAFQELLHIRIIAVSQFCEAWVRKSESSLTKSKDGGKR